VSAPDLPWLAAPVPPSKEVYLRLRRTSGSLMRELMNLEIAAIDLRGRVLDVGGGARASYVSRLTDAHDITSVNIDPEIEPTVVADLAEPLPFDDATYDTVLCFNTLEHLADDQFALNEMIRVLAPGGRLHILVPFLYTVHGHPNDYHRHTAHGWNVMLRRAGVPDTHQLIRPLVWDPFSTAWSLVDLAPLGRNWWRMRRVVRRLVLRRPLIMRPVDRRLTDDQGAIISNWVLGYVVVASKDRSEA
jgi:SAM-dependent methyltransferase